MVEVKSDQAAISTSFTLIYVENQVRRGFRRNVLHVHFGPEASGQVKHSFETTLASPSVLDKT